MTAVTKESLAARITELEAGPRSIKEDFQLEAYRMLQPKLDSCTWRYSEAEYAWASSCGALWCFDDGTPADNGCKFCHSCGRKIGLR